MCSCGHLSPAGRGMSNLSSLWKRHQQLVYQNRLKKDKRTFSWLNQSCVWNWIQAAASRFRLVAGMKPPGFLAMNRSLTTLGFGVQSSSSVGFWQYFLGKLRPNRCPEQPISGISSELNLPSEFLAFRNRLSVMGSTIVFPCAAPDAYPSWRLLARNSIRMKSKLKAPMKPGSLCHGMKKFMKWKILMNSRSRKLGSKVGDSVPVGVGFAILTIAWRSADGT